MKQRPREGDERGAVLIVSLCILAVLSLFAVSLTSILRLEARAASNVTDHTRARFCAEAGLERAIYLLTRSELSDPVTPFHAAWTYRSQDGTSWGLELPLAQARNPSFKEGEVDGYCYSGVVSGEYKALGDHFVLKVVDAASKLCLNGKQDRLPQMLDNLGRAILQFDEARRSGTAPFKDPGYVAHMAQRRQELKERGVPISEVDDLTRSRDPIRGRGSKIAALRTQLGGRFTSLDQLKAEPANLDDEDIARLRDYVSLDAWLDPAMVAFKSDGSEFAQPRAPVNVNTASWPVLVAVFQGIKAGKRVHLNDTNLEIDSIFDREIATEIDSLRRGPPGVPFRGWTDFNRWLDGRDLSPPAPRFRLNATQRAALKASCNPNLIYPRRSPDTPVHTGLGKSDLLQANTELSFISYGVYEITSLGRVLNPDGVLVGAAKIHATVAVYDTLRLLTQADFEGARAEQQEMTASFPNPVRALTGTYRADSPSGDVIGTVFEPIPQPTLRRARIQSASKRSGYVQLIAFEPQWPYVNEMHASAHYGTTIAHFAHLFRFGSRLTGEVWEFLNPASFPQDGNGAPIVPPGVVGDLKLMTVPGLFDDNGQPIRHWQFMRKYYPNQTDQPQGTLRARVHAHAVAAAQAADPSLNTARAVALLKLGDLYQAPFAGLQPLVNQVKAQGRGLYDEELGPDGLLVRWGRQLDLRYKNGRNNSELNIFTNRGAFGMWFKVNYSEAETWTPLMEAWVQTHSHSPLGPGLYPPKNYFIKMQVEGRLRHDRGGGYRLEVRSRRWTEDAAGKLAAPKLWDDTPVPPPPASTQKEYDDYKADERNPEAVDYNKPIYARLNSLKVDRARAGEWHYLLIPWYTNVHMPFVDGIAGDVTTLALDSFAAFPKSWDWSTRPTWPDAHCKDRVAPGGFVHAAIRPQRPAHATATIDELITSHFQLGVRPPRAGGGYSRKVRSRWSALETLPGWAQGSGASFLATRRYQAQEPDRIGHFTADLPPFDREVKIGRLLWTELLPYEWGPAPYASGDFQSQGSYRYSGDTQRNHLSGRPLAPPKTPPGTPHMDDSYVRYWRLRYIDERLSSLAKLIAHYDKLLRLPSPPASYQTYRDAFLAEVSALQAEKNYITGNFDPPDDQGAGSSLAFGGQTTLNAGSKQVRFRIDFMYFDQAQSSEPPLSLDDQVWYQSKVLNISPALDDVILPYQDRPRIIRYREE